MRIRPIGAVVALLAGLVLAPGSGRATSEEVLLEKIEQLELRIQDLEANEPRREERGGSWADHVRIGGSANTGYFGGEPNSLFDPDGFQIWDARLFVDADLGEAVTLGESTIFRNVGFSFEWDLVRVGKATNTVGELYVDFQGFLGSDAVNFQLGRFQVPVGEAYKRYSQGYAYKPFVSNPVGAPWWWDEGVRIYGADREDTIGYVASISDGETPLNMQTTGDKQLTLKLFWRPMPWLYLSGSALRTGKLGSTTRPAQGALWLGESWARSFGSGSPVPSYQNGAIVAPGPNRLAETWFVSGDVIVELEDKIRLWLAYGHYAIDSVGGSFYDRSLHTWIAEMIVRGAWVSDTLRPFYLGLRGSGYGTYDNDRGYLLDVRRAGTLGYNMETLMALSAVLGWELTANLRMRVEFTHDDIGLVGGVNQAIRGASRGTDTFAVEFGASF